MQAIKNILLLLFNGKILILLMTMQAAEEEQFNNITNAVIWLKLTVAKERQFNITNNVLLLFNVSTNNLLLTLSPIWSKDDFYGIICKEFGWLSWLYGEHHKVVVRSLKSF
jgi:hypothetical protein